MLLVEGPAVARDTARAMRLWRWRDSAWVLVDSSGPRRTGFSEVAWDESRNVLVVPVLFGGPDAGVWEWNGSRWTHNAAAGPSNRQTYGLTYAPHLRRVVLAGGQGSFRGPYFDDMWTWDGSRWTEVPRGSGPTPPGRGGGRLMSDASRNRLLYFGGYNEAPLADLWELTASGWNQLIPRR